MKSSEDEAAIHTKKLGGHHACWKQKMMTGLHRLPLWIVIAMHFSLQLNFHSNEHIFKRFVSFVWYSQRFCIDVFQQWLVLYYNPTTGWYVVTNLSCKGTGNGKYLGDLEIFVSSQNGESQQRKWSMKRKERITDNFKGLICGWRQSNQ